MQRGNIHLHQDDQGHGLFPPYCCLAFQATELLAIAHLQQYLAAYIKKEDGEAHRKAWIVYGCNIDFIQLPGKENYVLNYKDVSVSCQQQELYGPGS